MKDMENYYSGLPKQGLKVGGEGGEGGSPMGIISSFKVGSSCRIYWDLGLGTWKI